MRLVASLPLDLSWQPFSPRFGLNLAGSVVFGPGVASDTGKLARERLGAKRAFVVTDPGVAAVGILSRIEASLREAGIEYEVFDKVEPNPKVETAESAANAARAFAPDAVIGIGGGSSLDVAKCVGVLLTNDVPLVSLEGTDLIETAPKPIIAIPTTAGTGSEVTPFAVLTDARRQWKMAVCASAIIPSLAVCDPELTMSLPPAVTAATGMDALTHAVESYLAVCNQPVSEALALRAISLIAENLPKAYAFGTNMSARAGTLLGSLLAGLAFSITGVGIVHAMSHPLSALHGIPHGVANAVLLPVVMEFNAVGSWRKLADIARALGRSVDGLDEREAAARAVHAVRELSADLRIPRLSDLGVRREHLERLAAEAMKSEDRATNPRQTCFEDFLTLYGSAL